MIVVINYGMETWVNPEHAQEGGRGSDRLSDTVCYRQSHEAHPAGVGAFDNGMKNLNGLILLPVLNRKGC